MTRPGFCKQTSPFQEKVYFILNYSYFMRDVGGVEQFKKMMLWLPTWDDLREVLRDLGVSCVEVADFLVQQKAIESGQERLALYRLVEACLSNQATRRERSFSRDEGTAARLSVTDNIRERQHSKS